MPEPETAAAPLAGLRVLDLTRNVAGPFATQILADLGADVVKIEHPRRGDDTRAWGPPFWNGHSAVFLSLNRSKRSVCLDLHEEEAQAAAARLAGRADALVESFRPGDLDRLGLGVSEMHKVNPSLIYCSISGFGAEGPLRDRPGYDPLMQAMAGIMSVTGAPGGPPVRAGVSLIDMATGMWAAMAVMSSLIRPAGETAPRPGRHLQVSLFETALTWMSYHLAGYWATGEVPSPQGAGVAFLCPYGTFEARDGTVVITAANDLMFGRLCEVLRLGIDPADPRFATNRDRVRHRGLVESAIRDVTRQHAGRELEEMLAAHGIPCARILATDAVAEHPQAQELGIFQNVPHPEIGDLRLVGLPMTIDGQRARIQRPPPLLGEHTGEVLADWADPGQDGPPPQEGS
jgi:crotonobetainyl-CoA:carnitine CoA-transferase CaiB-like acyl-CoA transferase